MNALSWIRTVFGRYLLALGEREEALVHGRIGTGCTGRVEEAGELLPGQAMP